MDNRKEKAGEIPFFSSEKIAEGSWMIRNAFTARTPALCYLIEGRDFALLIDTMMGWGDLKAYCETLTDKTIVLANTHAHPDHTGGNFHFDACYLHHRDIPFFQDALGHTKEEVFGQAVQNALPEFQPLLKMDGNFVDERPVRVYPLYGGDVFDLGDRQIEVAEAGGHTPGSIVLIDHSTRIAYIGDACNGNTLLEFPNSLPVASYMRSLLSLRERRAEFDRMYGGHQIFGTDILDEAVETVARVLAGTDDRCERIGMAGKPVLYAAAKEKDGYRRVDGKEFNMSYRPENVWVQEPEHRTITLEMPAMI